MTPLIAMPAVPAATDPAAPAALRAEEWPAMPGLTRLLQGAGGRPAGMHDWRSAVLAAFDSQPATTSLTPAQIAAVALPALPPGSRVCHAAPLHAVAGISRMFLAPAGTVTLDAAQRESLRSAFNAEFGSDALQLHAVGTGWLLQAPFAQAADDPDPQRLGGAALTREPARSDDARALRRLGAEVEMWLSALPLNRAREQRGMPPLNCIWFWGGSQTLSLPRPAHAIRVLIADIEPDPWLAGLAALCNVPVRVCARWQDVHDHRGAVIVLQPPPLGDVLQQLPHWDANWFAPAAQMLGTPSLPALRLQIGSASWQLPVSPLARWLRRSQPWWQAVSA